MRPAEFYDMTWAEYQRAAIGYRVRLDRGWDYTRHIMTMLSAKGGRPDTFRRCIFDEVVKVERMSEEEWIELKRKWRIADA